MERRQWFVTAIHLTAMGLACGACTTGHAQPRYTVTTRQLQEAAALRFPMRYPVGGLLTLTLQAPQLRLLPARNRLGAEMIVDADGLALERSAAGDFDVDFALRYEPRDQSIRAHRLQVNSLRLTGLPSGPATLLASYGPALASQALQDVVLHRLTAQDLALSDGLGLEPGAITVTATGLEIGFVTKPLR